MALHYLNNDSETKVARNYSNPLPLQKTPFSIEDILYQRNHNSNLATSPGGGGGKCPAMTNHQQISGFTTSTNGQGKVTSSDQQYQQQSGSRIEMRSSESEKSHKTPFSDRLMSGKSQGHGHFVQPLSTGGMPITSSSSGHPGVSTYGGGSSVHSIYAQPTGPSYSDGYLHMIAPYLASTATGYKSVDPYFLSQGEEVEMRRC